MTFNDSNTVEAFIHDLLCAGIKHQTAIAPGLARRSGEISGLGWQFLSRDNLPRQPQDVLAETRLRDGRVRLNPTIAEKPERAATITVRDTGLVKANEEFAAWLQGERSMPFGQHDARVITSLSDSNGVEHEGYVVTRRFAFRVDTTEQRVSR